MSVKRAGNGDSPSGSIDCESQEASAPTDIGPESVVAADVHTVPRMTCSVTRRVQALACWQS